MRLLYQRMTIAKVVREIAGMGIGSRVVVGADSAFARDAPSLSAAIRQLHPPGDLGTVVAGPIVADGYTWWQVNYDTGADGWSTEPHVSRVP